MSAGWTVAVAESLTGGLLGAALTAVPGSSAAFRGGITAYSTPLKTELLGVEPGQLAAEGPVAARTANQMATGVRERLHADVGVATTGVAGPGPADGHPAGTVFLACVWPAGTAVRALSLTGDRAAVRAGSVTAALDLLLDSVEAPASGSAPAADPGRTSDPVGG